MSLLKIKNLSINYFVKNIKIPVLKKINLNIKENQIFGIAGESGSGKTTLGFSILRLLPGNAVIETGKISYKGINIFDLRQKDMINLRGNHIGMIFQDPLNALNPVYTAGFQVAEAIRFHKKIKDKKNIKQEVIKVFSEVNLKNPEEIADSYPHQLSGGMRQRVMIAQAISCNPALLIADEPTSNLDVTTQKNILDLFKELNKKINLTIILISHNLDLIKYMCSETAVIKDGKIVEQGDSERIFLNPENSYTKSLVNSADFFNK